MAAGITSRLPNSFCRIQPPGSTFFLITSNLLDYLLSLPGVGPSLLTAEQSRELGPTCALADYGMLASSVHLSVYPFVQGG